MPVDNILDKGLITIIKISKDERFYLESKGFVMGRDITRTHSRYKHYFAVEADKLITCLDKYRNNRLLKNKRLDKISDNL